MNRFISNPSIAVMSCFLMFVVLLWHGTWLPFAAAGVVHALLAIADNNNGNCR